LGPNGILGRRRCEYSIQGVHLHRFIDVAAADRLGIADSELLDADDIDGLCRGRLRR
jgi:hypothetical protein